MLFVRNSMFSMLSASARQGIRVAAGAPFQTLRHNGSGRIQCASDVDLNIDHLRERLYFHEDYLSYKPVSLLTKAINGYVPSVTKPHSFQPDWLKLGHQHVFFRPSLSLAELCDDGTDIKFLPGPKETWKYRLWAGGSVALHHRIPYKIVHGLRADLLERVSDVRVVSENGKAKRVFVTIERKVATFPRSHSRDQRRRILVQQKFPIRDQTYHYLTETENICFLREPPASLRDERRIKPPTRPTFSFTAVPNRNLLFQFSALTYNAHSIHIDRQFAQQEYGARDLVVHGPLTQIMMIEFLERYLRTEWPARNIIPVPKSINYTNISPLFVDEPLTLCCRPTSEFEGSPIDKTTSWNVWIEKGGNDNPSLAVKATIHIDAITQGEYLARGSAYPESPSG